MDNKELELRIKEILDEKNFFDMKVKALGFEKEYKTSGFYKETKMPLAEVIKEAKIWYLINLDSIVTKIQGAIDNLDLTKLVDVIGEFGDTIAQENADILEVLDSFKQIVK